MKEFMKDLYEAMGGKHLSTWLVQVAVWAIIILALPMATWLSTQDYIPPLQQTEQSDALPDLRPL